MRKRIAFNCQQFVRWYVHKNMCRVHPRILGEEIEHIQIHCQFLCPPTCKQTGQRTSPPFEREDLVGARENTRWRGDLETSWYKWKPCRYRYKLFDKPRASVSHQDVTCNGPWATQQTCRTNGISRCLPWNWKATEKQCMVDFCCGSFYSHALSQFVFLHGNVWTKEYWKQKLQLEVCKRTWFQQNNSWQITTSLQLDWKNAWTAQKNCMKFLQLGQPSLRSRPWRTFRAMKSSWIVSDTDWWKLGGLFETKPSIGNNVPTC